MLIQGQWQQHCMQSGDGMAAGSKMASK